MSPDGDRDPIVEGGSPPERIELVEPLEDFLTAKAKGRTSDSGTYRRSLEVAVQRFTDFLADAYSEPPRTFAELSARHLRAYARHLDGADLADGTVRTYYATLSAYLGWCVREGYLERNPARTDRAVEPLPEDDGHRSGDQQAWSPDQRRTLLTHLDDRAEAALERLAGAVAPDQDAVLDSSIPVTHAGDHDPALDPSPEGVDVDPDRARWDAIKLLRDRALAALLGYTGVRGAELLAHSGDDRRDGARWRDLDLEDGRLTVLAKDQTYDDRSVPAQAADRVARYRRLLDPAPDWPILVSLHRPSLYGRLRADLPDRIDEGSDVETLLDERSPLALCRAYDVAPPALSTDGARRVLQRLTEATEIEVDHPDHDYLTLHGARRGAGEAMVRAEGYAAAARLLNDTERMVRERYSHIEAGELAETATDAFDRVDR